MSKFNRIFWRFYGNNILSLLVLSGLLFIFMLISINPYIEHRQSSIVNYLANRLVAIRNSPDFHRDVVEMEKSYEITMQLFDESKRALLPGREWLLYPSQEEKGQLSHGESMMTRDKILLQKTDQGKTYYVVTMRPPSPQMPYDSLWVFVVMLTFSAGMAYPAARNLATPLEKLATTVRRFGAGDLSSRCDMKRQDEIGELAKSFDEMATRLESMLLSEKDILANVSHELRTPLARIRVILALASEEEACSASQYFPEIAADLQELETIVDDVLTAARLDISRRRASNVGPILRKQLIDPKNLLQQLAERFEERASGRKLNLILADKLPMLHADPTLLRRAIDNLLDNANKYSENDTTITLRASPEDLAAISIVVEDQGIGIDPEDQERIFSPFFRSEKSRARKRGGVGLGLTIVKRIVEAHEGSVSLQSQQGKGTRFELILPLASAA